MLKVKAGELFLSQGALSELVVKDLPNRTAMQLRRVIKRVEPEIKSFDEQRVKLAKDLGTPTEDGQSFQIEPDKLTEFNDQIKAMGEVEFEYSDLDQITDLGNVSVKASTLIALSWLIPE